MDANLNGDSFDYGKKFYFLFFRMITNKKIGKNFIFTAATNKAVNKIRNRASEFSSTSEKSESGSQTAFQRTRYNTAGLLRLLHVITVDVYYLEVRFSLKITEEERVYKTYSTGTAAQQVQYNGPELRLVDDEESDGEQPSTSGSAKGLSVKIVSLGPRVVRKGGKKTESHAKTVSSSGHARHRPTNDSDESVAKANAKAMQITVLCIVVKS